MMEELRKCTYNGKNYYFHQWFQEGGFQPNHYASGVFQEGSIDIGAILEDESGQIEKVFDVGKIKFGLWEASK